MKNSSQNLNLCEGNVFATLLYTQVYLIPKYYYRSGGLISFALVVMAFQRSLWCSHIIIDEECCSM